MYSLGYMLYTYNNEEDVMNLRWSRGDMRWAGEGKVWGGRNDVNTETMYDILKKLNKKSVNM